jgi:hypothetical protein
MDAECIAMIKDWVRLNNDFLTKTDALKDVKERMSSLEARILEHVRANSLEHVTVTTNDGKLRFAKFSDVQGLTIGYLKDKAVEFFKGDSAQADALLNHVLAGRSKTERMAIRRTVTT